MIASDWRALDVWRTKLGGHPVTCTELGEALYGQSGRTRQAYARPGGRVIARLVAAGLAARTESVDNWHRFYALTPEGRRAAYGSEEMR